MLIIILAISFLYLLLIGGFIIGFDNVNNFKEKLLVPKTKFSIVIPFRNESDNLPRLLDSILQLEYPKELYEILLIDDASTDDSVLIIKSHLKDTLYDWTILKNNPNTSSPKKDALKIGISESKYDWIITTDADCILPEEWLNIYDTVVQNSAYSLIAGPVAYKKPKSFLDHFQNLDFISLMGSTIGSFGLKKPFMANGANLAYKKALFHQLNGFEDDSNIASGDDVFLLQKAVRYNSEQVGYLKAEGAIVLTNPQPTWQQLVYQRVRWASKSIYYKSAFSIFTAFTVFFMNILCVILLLSSITGLTNFFTFLSLFVFKSFLDFILINKTSGFLGHQIPFIRFLISSILYPFFTTYIVTISTFKNYDWKGRTFNK
ncbi:glycosyltransferase family 2 protein [Hanstruepera ponticola]|uniref:glycosyltransferase family 2 protein n=1 Tax=Hanstruepera ponticola TaxID=2042995 RepID=UPI000CF1363C|nr:glycosyltransferase [Hanstruepera ponticola]